MNKFLILMLSVTLTANAQLPETDIFLVKMNNQKGEYNFSAPKNITQRPGYDNQPCFSPDNKKILYVIADTIQSDVYSYDIAAGKSVRMTDTKESEYSPTFTPDKKYISVVRIDADSGQRFYKLPIDKLSSAELIKNSDSIGYSCWLNDSNVAMFILGPSNTLQLLNTKSGERKLIASDIGRCMRLTPDKKKMLFILKSNDAEWFIYEMSVADNKLTRLAQTMKGSEDFAILPDGNIIMGNAGKLYSLVNGSWKIIVDFSETVHDFYRITVSPDGKMLALVAFTGKKP